MLSDMNNLKMNHLRVQTILIIIICIIGAGLIWSGCNYYLENTNLQSDLVLAADNNAVSESTIGYQRADGPIVLNFPDDYGPHPDYQTEWWYYTGNLETPEGRHFGYQLTFFRRALLPPEQRLTRSSNWSVEQVYMAHFALTDTASNQHHAFERLARGSAGIAGAQAEPYKVWLQDWRIEETGPDTYKLVASKDEITLSLVLNDLKGPVLHGVDGYSQKGPDPGNASYYYSQTRLDTEGILSINDKTYSVAGLSWKDHEYSTSALSEGQVGWDWFSIQLSDFSELMVFQLRREDGSIDHFSSGTLINADGSLMHLGYLDFEIEVQDRWKSTQTGATYPIRWLLSVPKAGIQLELTPHIQDQEMKVSYTYWEGAVYVNGQKDNQPVTGNGYVELSGYAGSLSGEF